MIIRLVVLAVFIAWCFPIFRSFIRPVAWGFVIPVTLLPICEKINGRLVDRRKLTAAVVIFGLAMVVILPGIQLAVSSADHVHTLNVNLQDEGLKLSPPPILPASQNPPNSLSLENLYPIFTFPLRHLHFRVLSFHHSAKALTHLGLRPFNQTARLKIHAALAVARRQFDPIANQRLSGKQLHFRSAMCLSECVDKPDARRVPPYQNRRARHRVRIQVRHPALLEKHARHGAFPGRDSTHEADDDRGHEE